MVHSFSFLKRLENTARVSAALVVLAMLVVLSVTALPIPFSDVVRPHLVLMAVYYWAVYRPTLVPPIVCFSCGLVMDVLSGGPAGLNAFVLVAVQWVVRRQRRFLMGQPFVTIWAVFAVVNIMGGGIEYLLVSAYHGQWLPPVPSVIPVAAGVALFPFVSMLLVSVHRIMPVATRTRP